MKGGPASQLGILRPVHDRVRNIEKIGNRIRADAFLRGRVPLLEVGIERGVSAGPEIEDAGDDVFETLVRFRFGFRRDDQTEFTL